MHCIGLGCLPPNLDHTRGQRTSGERRRNPNPWRSLLLIHARVCVCVCVCVVCVCVSGRAHIGLLRHNGPLVGTRTVWCTTLQKNPISIVQHRPVSRTPSGCDFGVLAVCACVCVAFQLQLPCSWSCQHSWRRTPSARGHTSGGRTSVNRYKSVTVASFSRHEKTRLRLSMVCIRLHRMHLPSLLGLGSPSWWNQSWFYNPF